MIVNLNERYWIDGSDGLNWTLRQGKPTGERKKGKVLGYYSTLRYALQAAILKEVCEQIGATTVIGSLAALDAEIRRAADSVAERYSEVPAAT